MENSIVLIFLKLYIRLLLHLSADAVQLHSLPKGALCSFDVSQLLPQKGAAAHTQRERSIPKCIVAQLSSAKRNSSTARGSICAKFFSVQYMKIL